MQTLMRATPTPPRWRPCSAAGQRPAAPDVAWAAARLLGAMAAEETVVVVLEDVHWADDMLLDVVDQLLVEQRRRSLMVVCTARPEFAERRPGWGAGGTCSRSRSNGSTMRRR